MKENEDIIEIIDEFEDIPTDEFELNDENKSLISEYEQSGFFEHHRLRVDPGQGPMRVDIYLSTHLRNTSRTKIKSACDAGYIKVNGNCAKASYKVKPYDEISIVLPYPPAPELVPEDIPLDIIYEDSSFLIVNKPAGMVCHPGCGNYNGTLINALLFHFQKLKENEAINLTHEGLRPGLIHRIDKDTTGLLVIAKTENAYNFISKQFFERTTKRNYYALVWGNLKNDKGTITGNVGRSLRNRKQFMVYEDGSMGKYAVTHYEVIQRFGVVTLVKCKLETGRTHQIRVHFKYIGHTLFGDYFYGGHRTLKGKPSKGFANLINDCLTIMNRQALHAKTLGFIHPETKEEVFFDSELPDDFKEILYRFSKFMNVPLIPEIQNYQPSPKYANILSKEKQSPSILIEQEEYDLSDSGIEFYE
jgi:23S rRNA pseudouridine1911/1915/1917 synthase